MRAPAGVLTSLTVLVLLGCGKVEEGAGSGGAPGSGGEAASGGAPGSGGASACLADDDDSQACRDERRRICGQRAIEECQAVPYCQTRTAWPIDEAAECMGDILQEVGCGEIGCTATYSRSVDPAGNEWMFPSGCQPDGWTNITTGTSLAFCSEPSGAAGAGP